jgi:hypothetical protein
MLANTSLRSSISSSIWSNFCSVEHRMLQSCSTNGFLVMEWGLWNLLEFTRESSSDGGVNSILLTVNKSSDNSMWNLLEEVCVSQFSLFDILLFLLWISFSTLKSGLQCTFCVSGGRCRIDKSVWTEDCEDPCQSDSISLIFWSLNDCKLTFTFNEPSKSTFDTSDSEWIRRLRLNWLPLEGTLMGVDFVSSFSVEVFLRYVLFLCLTREESICALRFSLLRDFLPTFKATLVTGLK